MTEHRRAYISFIIDVEHLHVRIVTMTYEELQKKCETEICLRKVYVQCANSSNQDDKKK